MPLFGVFVNKPPVEVMDDIRSSPVEVGQNGGGVRGYKAANHQADKSDRQEFEHRRIGDIVAEQLRIEVRKRRLNIRQLWIDDDLTEPDQYPGPRAQHVMGDVKKQYGAQRIFLRFRGEHALRDVTSAAGLSARIPDGPPLNRYWYNEDRHRDIPVVRKVGKNVQIVDSVRAFHRGEFVNKPAEAADLRKHDCEIGRRDHRGHLDEELDHIDHQYSPQP